MCVLFGQKRGCVAGFEQGATHDFWYYEYSSYIDTNDQRWEFSKQIATILTQVDLNETTKNIDVSFLQHLFYNPSKHSLSLQIGIMFKVLFNAELTKQELSHIDGPSFCVYLVFLCFFAAFWCV